MYPVSWTRPCISNSYLSRGLIEEFDIVLSGRQFEALGLSMEADLHLVFSSHN
jgi:hypothetical protein